MSMLVYAPPLLLVLVFSLSTQPDLLATAEPGDEEAAAPNVPAAVRDHRGERAPRGGREPAERQPHRGGLGAHQAAQRAPSLPAERLSGEGVIALFRFAAPAASIFVRISAAPSVFGSTAVVGGRLCAAPVVTATPRPHGFLCRQASKLGDCLFHFSPAAVRASHESRQHPAL